MQNLGDYANIIYSGLFYVLYVSTTIGALTVILARNPVISVLALIATFVMTSAVWLLQQAEFLAMTLVVVYVGAVMVLFLFVVMMLNIKDEVSNAKLARTLPFALLFFVAFGWILYKLSLNVNVDILDNNLPLGVVSNLDYSNARYLGEELFTRYLLHFEMAGVILLVAIVSAIGLVVTGKKVGRRQNVSQQLSVIPSDRLTIIPGDSL